MSVVSAIRAAQGQRSEVSEERLRKADDVVWRALAGRVARYVAFAAGGNRFFFGGSVD